MKLWNSTMGGAGIHYYCYRWLIKLWISRMGGAGIHYYYYRLLIVKRTLQGRFCIPYACAAHAPGPFPILLWYSPFLGGYQTRCNFQHTKVQLEKMLRKKKVERENIRIFAATAAVILKIAVCLPRPFSQVYPLTLDIFVFVSGADTGSTMAMCTTACLRVSICC